MPRGPRADQAGPDILMVFLRYPVKGFVKTRLAQEIGEDGALNVYKILLKYTLYIIEEISGVEIYLFYSMEGHSQGLPKPKDRDWKVLEQSAGDLGQRFENAFQTVFGSGARKAVVIGTDCIGLQAETIQDAFASLDDNDIVIGPTEDGGYYLIGMKGPLRVFGGITWSTEKVFEQTREKIDALGLKAGILPVLYDVDTNEDWERAKKEDPRIPSIIPSVTGNGGEP